MDEETKLRWYLINSKIVRERYGLGKDENGKIFIQNKELIEKLPTELKANLRSAYKELMKAGIAT